MSLLFFLRSLFLFTTTSHPDDDNSSLYDISQTDVDGNSALGFQPTFAQNRKEDTQAPPNLDGKSKS